MTARHVDDADQSDTDSDDDRRRWLLLWQHRAVLVRFARTRGVSLADAEDIVHEAIVRAMESPSLEQARARGWLVAVTARLAADLYRGRLRDARLRERGIELFDHARFDERYCDQAEAEWAARLIDTLPARQRDALTLRAHGHSVSEIAGRMEVTYRTAESLLARARSTVRAAIVSASAVVVAVWTALARPFRALHAHDAFTLTAVTLSAVACPLLLVPMLEQPTIPAPRSDSPSVSLPQTRPEVGVALSSPALQPDQPLSQADAPSLVARPTVAPTRGGGATTWASAQASPAPAPAVPQIDIPALPATPVTAPTAPASMVTPPTATDALPVVPAVSHLGE